MSILQQGYRFCIGFRKFLKKKLSLEECREIVMDRMENREEYFLRVVEKGIYGNKNSPYLELLKLAGYEFSDIKSLVSKLGVEGALNALREDGVYVRYEEFKGMMNIVRKGRILEVTENAFDNPFPIRSYIDVRSGGSTTGSAGTRYMLNFESLPEEIATWGIMLNMFNALEDPVIIYHPILPAGSGIKNMLRCYGFGNTPIKWYSQVDERSIRATFKRRLATNYIIHMGRILGANFPKPEFIQLNDVSKITEFISETIRSFSRCTVKTYASSAVRICNVAKEKGIEIDGTMFINGGEPLTPTKIKEIESTGCTIVNYYAFTEVGGIGSGCPRCLPISDDIHIWKHRLAVTQYEREVIEANLFVNAFLFTTLSPASPKILLNVESDDDGVIESRRCGCEFDDYGFFDHIHNIRSFGKLTSEGMTLIGTKVIKVIEEFLPSKFGGDSTDYQLLEEEDEKGLTRLNILVSPNVGNIDEKDLLSMVLRECSNLVGEVWSQAGSLQVKRVHPVPTKRGKIMPFHALK